MGQIVCRDLFLSTPSARRATSALGHITDTSTRFLSTPSARRATAYPAGEGSRSQISIHALREEGDGSSSKGNGKACKFLSTPSARRATSGKDKKVFTQTAFLSTPSARRATR